MRRASLLRRAQPLIEIDVLLNRVEVVHGAQLRLLPLAVEIGDAPAPRGGARQAKRLLAFALTQSLGGMLAARGHLDGARALVFGERLGVALGIKARPQLATAVGIGAVEPRLAASALGRRVAARDELA